MSPPKAVTARVPSSSMSRSPTGGAGAAQRPGASITSVAHHDAGGFAAVLVAVVTALPSRLGVVCIGAALLSAPSAFAGAPRSVDGFPAEVDGKTYSEAVSLADLDADDGSEIITTAEQSLLVLEPSGAVRDGFPVDLQQPGDRGLIQLHGAPAVCDVDADGVQEIAIGDDSGRVFNVDANGELQMGFPVTVPGAPKGSISCVEGAKSGFVMTTQGGWLVRVRPDGGQPERLQRIGQGAESGVGVADLDGDGELDFVVVGGDARVYVVTQSGRRWREFDYRLEYRVSGTPAIGDINDDGRPDIVVTGQDFRIHAVGVDGAPLAGFPVKTGYRLYGGAALGDLDADGVVEIVAGSGDSKLYALDGDGTALSGFPRELNGRVIAAPIIADFNRDGRQDIAAITQAGSVYVLTAAGKRFPGFPTRIGGKCEVAPAAGDLDADGLPELVAHTPLGRVYSYTFADADAAKRALVAWGTAAHAASNSGRYAPNEGRFKNLTFSNPEPKTTDPVQAKYTFFDLDGDPEQDTQIRWYKDGEHQADLDNVRTVPADKTRKHEVWHYTLQAGGNFAAYGEDGLLARQFTSQKVEVLNTAPSAPQISLTPEVPKTTATLKARVTKASTDPDADDIVYRYIWLRDSRPKDYPTDRTEVPPADIKKNERWRVVVVPFDGEVEGQSTSAAVSVINTPPEAPKIALEPSSPRIEDRIRVRITADAPDADQDSIHYAYRYWVNERPLDLPQSLATVPAGALRKHQELRVRVTAWDDEEAGASTEASLVVQNTPPAAPKIAIWPQRPETSQPLQLTVLEQEPDADGDRIDFRHQWTRDGEPVDYPLEVPAAETQKGQSWRVEVTPVDGEAEGPSVAAEAVVRNTPPTTPMVRLQRYRWTTDKRIEPRIERAAEDVNGDSVRLRYRWSRKGKPQPFPEDKDHLLPSETAKGERWRVRITPTDGDADGEPTELRFRIVNSAPTAPSVSLNTTAPTVRDRVKVTIDAAATDADEDALSYHYRWYRNGVLQDHWPLDRDTLRPGTVAKGEQWRVEVRAYDGQVEGPRALAELVAVNHPPTPPKVAVRPRDPGTRSDLRCAVVQKARDPDKDSLMYHYRWFVDGEPVGLDAESAKVPAALTREKQSWHCEARAFDGTTHSQSASARAVSVLNSPPEAPVVSIAPKKPRTDAPLLCQLDKLSTDADLDELSYDYKWWVGRKRWKPSAEEPANRVPAAVTRRGQRWRCAVTPKDGETTGPRGSARTRVVNSAPTRPKVKIQPRRPVAGQTLSCKVYVESTDADDDRVRYRFIWFKDGVRQSFAPTSTKVPGRLVKPKDVWRCAVTPTDGKDAGPKARSPDVLIERQRRAR